MTPLLLELGARVPARGLFVIESELNQFPTQAATWVAEQQDVLEFYVRGGAPDRSKVVSPTEV